MYKTAHRALEDCFALLVVISRPPAGPFPTLFAELYKASQRTKYLIRAENSPSNKKDDLRKRGYRWRDARDGGGSWCIKVSREAVDKKMRYLRNEIFKGSTLLTRPVLLTAVNWFRSD